MTLNNEQKGYGSALISNMSVAFGFIGMQYMIQSSTALTAQVVFFMTGALLTLGLLLLTRGHIRLHSLKRNWKTYAAVCLLMAFTATMTFVGIGLIGAGPVSFVGQLGVVFGVLLGALVLHESLRPLDAVGGLVAIAGALCMTYAPGEYMRLGVMVVLVSSVSLAVHNLVIKRHAAEVDKLELLFVRAITTCAAVIVLTASTGQWHHPPIWLVPVGALTSIFGFVLVNFFRYVALGYIDMSKEAMMRVISPLMVTVLSFLVFSTVPGRIQLVGSALILGGVSMILFRPLFQPHRSVPVRAGK